MPYLIAGLSVALAFLIAYPVAVQFIQKLLPASPDRTGFKKITANLIALIFAAGLLKVFNLTLGILFLDLSVNYEKLAQAFIIALFFPAILFLVAKFLHFLLDKFRILAPKEVDESVYLDFANEARGERRREALWTKCLIKSKGNENHALSEYVNARINESRNSTNAAQITNPGFEGLSPKWQAHKIRIYLLLSLIAASLLAHIYKNDYSSENIPQTMIESEGKGTLIYKPENCQFCIDDRCAEGQSKIGVILEEIIVDYDLGIGLGSGQILYGDGDFRPASTTPWSGCKYQLDEPTVSCFNYFESTIEKGKFFRQHRELNRGRYRYFETMENKEGQILGKNSLVCDVKIESKP